MCYRYFLSFCVCSFLLVSCSVCLADSAVSIDGDYVFEQEPYQVFGFDDEQPFFDFLVFLSGFSGGDDVALEEYYNSSDYSFMGHSISHLRTLYDYIQENGVEPLTVGSEWSISLGSVYGPTTNSITFSNNSYSGATTYITFKDVPRTSYGSNGYRYEVSLANLATTTYVDQAIARAASSWTTSDVSTLLAILGKQHYSNYSIWQFLSMIGQPTGKTYYYSGVRQTGSGTTSVGLQTGSTLMDIVADGVTTLNRVREYSELLNNRGAFNQTVHYVSSDGTYTSSGTSTYGESLGRLLNTFYYTLGRGNDQYFYHQMSSNGAALTRESVSAKSVSISTILSHLTSTLDYGLFGFLNSSYLNFNGEVASGSMSLLELTRRGFQGLNFNMETALVGSHGHTATIDLLTFDSDLFPEELPEGEELPTVNNLLDAIVTFGNAIQRPVSQLQAVLANDDDLELRRQTQEQVDAVTKDFTGDGGSAPTVSDIGDMSTVSKDFSGMLDSGVGPGQFIAAVNGGDTYNFFSQAVSDDLNGQAQVVNDDDFLDDYEFDEYGFGSLKDTSFFSISDFLRGVSGD